MSSCGSTLPSEYGVASIDAGDALARALDAVGPDEVLREPPERGLLLAQHAALAPAGERRAAAASGESGSVRWTMLYGLVCQR